MHYGDGYGDGVWSIDLCRRGKIVLCLGISGVVGPCQTTQQPNVTHDTADLQRSLYRMIHTLYRLVLCTEYGWSTPYETTLTTEATYVMIQEI